MHQSPSEIIFSLAPAAGNITNEPCIFRYDYGALQLRPPRKRGRPKGSTKKRNDSTTTVGSHFDFINVTNQSKHVDHESRVKIRRHVMVNYMTLKHKKPKEFKDQLVLPPQVTSVDPFDAFPFRLEPYMHDLLKYYITIGWKTFYSIEKHAEFNPMTDYWIALAFQDSAFLHTLLGCADSLSVDAPWRGIQSRPRATRHLNAAISLVNERIANLEFVTDEMLVVVATIAILEKSRGAHAHWSIHMEGLRKLVHLRGGFSCLESKPLLMGKLQRADLCGSIDAVQEPYFAGRYNPTFSITSDTNILNGGFQQIDDLINLDKTLKLCLTSLEGSMKLMKCLISNKGGRVEAARLRFGLTATQYTLLSAHFYSNHAGREFFRLTLILFSECLFNEKVPSAPVCDMLITRLQNLYRQTHYCLLTAEFSLWAMFLAAFVASNKSLKNWCLLEIVEFNKAMDINSWERTVEVLELFLWDSHLFGEQFRKIWDESFAFHQSI
ncbi:hypothetical protein BGW36DRAFT_386817 [Talaromyces proteolyticus]|uniref:Transcription factor domain-containing protein n=1 Tax=Talaromyces proteolyticus TaxID=1131652 RepID=A0AAD4KGS1_9EURO|nr:uncharacterized protein BGW36DRAFT_386817 [Talaromyces proteolyticus]KAH8692013.1 hypothetical protein BGW36DRAFT_386817 [Talaromyces proteolyticus]